MAIWEQWFRHAHKTDFGRESATGESAIARAFAEFWLRVFQVVAVEKLRELTLRVDANSGCFGVSYLLISVIIQFDSLRQFCKNAFPGVEAPGEPMPDYSEFEKAVDAEVLRYLAQARQQAECEFQAVANTVNSPLAISVVEDGVEIACFTVGRVDLGGTP